MRQWRWLLILCAVWVVFLAIGAYALLRSETGEAVTKAVFDPGKAAFGDDRTSMNILLLGVDYNYTNRAIRYTKGARSDTIVVVRVDRWGSALSMLSVPRDSRVYVDAAGQYTKINDAFALGGPRAARATIEEFLGIKIDHHILVKVDAAAKLVDTLGGVPLTVEKEMDYDDNWANFHVHLKPGPQRLNGKQVVGYCRFRHDEEGDFGRMRRQQQFLTALVRELKKPSNLKRIPQLAELARENLETDLTTEQMMGLGNLYRGFPLSRLRKGTVPCDDAWIDDIAYLIPREQETQALVRQLFTLIPDPTLGELSTEIVNGTQVPGASAPVATQLHQAGFALSRSRMGGPTVYTRTTAIVRTQHPDVEKQLKLFLGDIAVEHEAPRPGAPDVTVIVGD
ncbi:MAG: LCP family protein [Candidatus Eremiobacteraeota bacterium]|nr:LCP family protein [Candidatus Eremiobacteraeota bacterium]